MAVWKVLYASWETECCGTPFSVGNQVVTRGFPETSDVVGVG
jgi:hypothetical protein